MRRLLLLTLFSSAAAGAIAQPCTTSWVNAANGLWSVAANWDNGVPTAASHACITVDGTYTVTAAAAITADRLTLGGASGVQTLVATTGMSIGTVVTVGGNGVLQWTNGYMTGGTLHNGGLVQLTGGSSSRGVNGATLRNEGTVEHSGTGFFYVYGGGRVENAAAWNATGSGNIQGSTGTGTFVNEASGTFAKSGTGTTVFTGGNLVVENAGAIDVQGGTLRFDRPSTHTAATLTTASGATLRFNTGGVTFVGMTGGAQAGALEQADAFVAGSGATWNFSGTGLTWISEYLTSGTLTNTGLVRLSGGASSRGVNGATLRNEGTVEHSGTGFFYVYGGGRVENAAAWTATGSGGIYGFTSAGTFVNEAGATFTKTGTGTTLFTGGGLVVENAGTIDVQGGTLRFDRPSTHTAATLTTADGATLHFNAGLPTFVGTQSGAQAGALQISTNFAAGADAVWAFSGLGLEWTADYLNAGTLTNAGLVRLSGGTGSRGLNGAAPVFRNTGTVEHSGTGLFYIYDGGRAENAGLWEMTGTGQVLGFTGTGLFANEAGATLRKSGATLNAFSGAGLSVQNAGTVDVAAGTLRISSPFNHQAGAQLTGAGTFERPASGFTFDGDVAPGSTVAPGVLTFAGGAYAPSATSTLGITLGGLTPGSEHDRLAAAGAAMLDGVLELRVADTFAPTVGQAFTVLTAISVGGTFASIVGPPGYVFTADYQSVAVVVTVAAVGVVTVLTAPDDATTPAEGEGWRMLAPAVAASTFDDLVGTLWTQGFPGADYPSGGQPNVLIYDETVAGDRGNGFVPPANQTDALAPGTGVFVYVYADDDYNGPEAPFFPKTIVQSGADVLGPFTFSATHTDSGDPDADGWNLLGNPFAASMDWDAPGWTRANVDQTIYVWDHEIASYLTWNGVAGSLGDGRIAPAQGFWVHATAPPTLIAPVEARTTGAPFVGRESVLADAAVLGLRVAEASGGRLSASAHVVLADGALDAHDPLDGFALAPLAPTALALFTERLADGVALDIQALAPRDEAMEIGLGVAAWRNGAPATADLVLTWPEMRSLDAPVTLVDHATGETVDLRVANQYAFRLDATATTARTTAPAPGLRPARLDRQSARFALVIGASVVTTGPVAPPLVTALTSVSPNPLSGRADVRYALAAPGEVTITVHDLLGREIMRLVHDEQPAGTYAAPLDAGRFAAGLYIVRMTGPEGFAATRRITIIR